MLKKKPTYQELENQIIELKKVQIDSNINKRDQYQTIFDSMTEMLEVIELIYDGNGKPIDFHIRDINLSFAKFLGKTKDQLIDQKVSTIINVVEDYWLTTFASVESTGRQATLENYSVEFDKYYYVTAWKITSNRVGVSYTDVTDRKRRKKQELATKLAFDLIKYDLDQAQKLAKIGSWLFNPTTQKAEWSDEMFRIWWFDPSNGTPENDLVVKRIHPEDLDLYNYSIAKASSQGTPYDIEFRIQHTNGEQKIVRAICQSVPGGTVKLRNLNGINQDITSQKLFEKNLVKDQRLKAIGEMSSSIAHDFNNSLQEMMGNLEIIRLQNYFSGSTLERLNNIKSIITDTAGRATALQQFGDTEHENRQAESINLNTLIIESLKETRPLWKDSIEKSGLKISIQTDFEDLPEIICNRGELKSSFYNLIKNSVEAMPDGGDIIIKTGLKAEGVYTSFTDSGRGMDEETKLKICEPFYSTKGLGLGRGLGMSGVYTIVKKHRGSLDVKFSELGKGTTIEMTFPIGPEDETNNISVTEVKDKGALAILWVDDDIRIRETASELLKLMGHTCDTANSGKSALQYLSRNACDVVFTDIGMPDMNGWDLADAIRNQLGNKIKIIVASGWDVEEKVKDEHDINAILRKPFDLEKIKETLRMI